MKKDCSWKTCPTVRAFDVKKHIIRCPWLWGMDGIQCKERIHITTFASGTEEIKSPDGLGIVFYAECKLGHKMQVQILDAEGELSLNVAPISGENTENN